MWSPEFNRDRVWTCLLIVLMLTTQIESVCGQTLKGASTVTVVGGYSSFLYEHGGVIPDIAGANFEVVNTAAKTASLKILRVELVGGGNITRIKNFTVDVRRKQAGGREVYADVKPGQAVIVRRHSRLALIINFPSSHLALYSKGEQHIRLQCAIGRSTLEAETRILVKRMEPWRPRPTRRRT